MAPEEDAGEVAADIAAHGQDDEDQDAPGPVGHGQHERDESRHQRQVADREDPGGHVPQVAGRPAVPPDDATGLLQNAVGAYDLAAYGADAWVGA